MPRRLLPLAEMAADEMAATGASGTDAPGADAPVTDIATRPFSALSPSIAPGTVVGGYRLVRVLGEGSRATVHLGFADGATAEQPPRTAAVKIHHDGISLDEIDREIEALTRVDHPHAIGLADLAALPSGRPCLVFERLGPGSLAQLVADRSEIAPGEAVTLIAPLASALDELHRAGVAHGRVRTTSVLFRESGAPVLVGFGAAVLLAPGQPPAVLAANELVLGDRRHLALLATSVLERVQGDSARAVLDALAHDGVALDDFGDRLAERLFEFAEPEPVRALRRGEATRALGSVRSPVAVAVMPSRETRAGVRDAWGGAGGWMSRAAVALASVLRGQASAIRVRARGVRPRFWVVAGAVAVSLLAAVVVVPRGAVEEPPRAGDPPPSPTPAPTPVSTADNDAVAHDDSPMPTDPVHGDDPLAALAALLDERERCLRDMSVLCLDGVLQPGSAALQHDAALIRALQDGGEVTSDEAIVANTPVVVERLGDSALVGFGDVPDTQPASTLMMRGEAGWRIRDYVTE